MDHAGNNGSFPKAQLVTQRLQHEVALAGHPRFISTRSQWDLPATRYQLIDGDLELLPASTSSRPVDTCPATRPSSYTFPKADPSCWPSTPSPCRPTSILTRRRPHGPRRSQRHCQHP
ncbi:hypothetical protein [Dictyobacter vulcani]|uniref:hypothetical protein n=1 Tax=Dictyobacter vulcani TaxID=2607529 RepID=UPI00353133D3